MKQKAFLFFSLAMMIFFSGCAKPQDRLLGTWKTISGGQDIYFTFQKDHTLNVNNEVFMNYFVTKDNKLILGQQEAVSFSIKSNTLRIMQEGHTVLTYTKVK